MTILYTLGSSLYLNLTNRCPCRCNFCIRKNGPGVGDGENLWLEREPTVEEVIDQLRQAPLDSYSQIVFCGYGEPLERIEDVAAICRYLRSATDCKIRINTNGLADLIHGRPTASMLRGLIDTISISLNTCTAEKYMEMCRPMFGIRSFRAMLDFAQSCKSVIPEVILSVVDVIPQEDIDQCCAIAEELGVEFRVRTYES